MAVKGSNGMEQVAVSGGLDDLFRLAGKDKGGFGMGQNQSGKQSTDAAQFYRVGRKNFKRPYVL